MKDPLQAFKQHELIFDEDETVAILKFIFRGQDRVVDALTINTKVRSFAQAALLIAAERSYAIGFVEATFSSVTRPTASVKKALGKLIKNLGKHGMKQFTQRDLMTVDIYETVRAYVAYQYVHILQNMKAMNYARNPIGRSKLQGSTIDPTGVV
jgi:hypothetical protein